jgi:rhamnosyltransferase
MSDHVCAVIVTFHPDQDFAQHIAILRPQVGGLVVVDNRSNDTELALLRELAERYSFRLLENPDNLGLGAALNRGVQWAAADGRFRYVVLFDQDSEASDGFVGALLSHLQKHPARDRIAVAAPRIYNRNTKSTDGPKEVRGGRYLVAQTSGSLMPLSVFNAEGWFLEELFIDYVDYEYCLRAVTAGWVILYCEEAVLSHVPGNSRRHTLFGLYLGTTGNYNPMRHYYLVRNGMWVLRKYWKRHGMWCAKQALLILKELTKVFLFEENRPAKLGFAAQGFKDALQGKLGKLDDPADEKRLNH